MIEPYNKLVKLAARAFYDDLTSEGDNQPKKGRSDNRGIAVVVLDALTRRQWVREEDLAKDLKLHTKQLRRSLQLFEDENIITRDHRRETAKGAKIYSAAVAATADATTGKEKLHTHSYCCLDYAHICDVVRYKLHWVMHELKDELENKSTFQKYTCTKCGKRYNSLDASRLLSYEDGDFLCEHCNGKLEFGSDKLAAQEGGDGDENARRRRREKLKDMLKKMEVQLKPLIDQLGRVKDLPVPEFGSLQAWEAQAGASVRAANGDNAGDSKCHLGYNGAPMPCSGDTKDEYITACYAGLLKKLEEAVNTQDANAADDPSSSTSLREVGRKSKREEDDDGTKWEEAPVREDNEDGIDQEEG
ncbi:hypothetical protein P8452_24400 [Trifolium repens]|nr:hypothetical protein P8452_24400 [Trifolium repens]